MLIRSKNKMHIVNIKSGVVSAEGNGTVEFRKGKIRIVLGEYSSLKKSIKVLDLIQDAKLRRIGFFQMPDDSEVLEDSPEKIAAKAIQTFVAHPDRTALTNQFMDYLKLAAEVLEGLK